MRLVLAAFAVFAVLAASAVIATSSGLPVWLAAIAIVAALVGAILLVLRLFLRPRVDLPGTRSKDQIGRKLENGDLLEDEEFQAHRALQVEEFEDEGSIYLLALDDGALLWLVGQYLYKYEPGTDAGGQAIPRRFPNTRFRVRRHRTAHDVVDIECMGAAFEPEAVVPYFEAHEIVPTDGEIIRTESFDDAAGRLRSRPQSRERSSGGPRLMGCGWGLALLVALTALGIRLFPAMDRVLVVAASGAICLATGWAVGRYRLGKHGFLVTGANRDEIRYMERATGGDRSLVIPGQAMGHGRHLVYIPGERAWRSKMPEWARDRRDEILRRIREALPPDRYEFTDKDAPGS